MRVLIVVAHPDDAEIAMGMRMRWYADNGADIHVHALTTGLPTRTGRDEREQECLAAGAVLGVKTYTFSDIPDTRFSDHRGEINAELVRVVATSRPDVVYTHHPTDQHLDHTVTATEATAIALRDTANLTYFRSPYSTSFDPTLIFMSTPDLLAAKTAALACFVSQHQWDMDTFAALARVAYRQHVHHRVLGRLPRDAVTAELFTIARRVEVASRP